MPRYKIKLCEQAAGRDEYIPVAYNYEEIIYCHCAYFLVYDMPETENHWKQELWGFVRRLKKIKVSSGDKGEYTEIALVTMAHGRHFCEDKAEPAAILETVYNSEDKPHAFDFDMKLEHNLAVYFDSIDRFYYEFLIQWIADSIKEPPKEPLYAAIDRYLITARKKMIGGGK